MNPERPVPYLSVPFQHYRQRPTDQGWDFVPMRLHLRCTPAKARLWGQAHREVQEGRLGTSHTIEVDEEACVSIQDTKTEYAFVLPSFLEPAVEGYGATMRLTDEDDIMFVIEPPESEARPIATDPLHAGVWDWLDLYWAEPDAMPAIFRRMAERFPGLALDVLTGGLVLHGDPLPALNRAFTGSLSLEDVAPLLSAETRSVREAALSCLPDLQERSERAQAAGPLGRPRPTATTVETPSRGAEHGRQGNRRLPDPPI